MYDSGYDSILGDNVQQSSRLLQNKPCDMSDAVMFVVDLAHSYLFVDIIWLLYYLLF